MGVRRFHTPCHKTCRSETKLVCISLFRPRPSLLLVLKLSGFAVETPYLRIKRSSLRSECCKEILRIRKGRRPSNLRTERRAFL